MHLFSILTLVSVATASFTMDLAIKKCDKNGCTAVQKRVALDSTSTGTSKFISVGAKDALTLSYGGPDVGGPRVYLIEEEGVNKNTMFILNNQEFTFDVDLSTMPCGFNAALYFVGMTENEGGAENGTNYCDAQAVGGTFCSEMDILEANTRAQQYTTHACVDKCGSFTTNVPECQGSGSPSSVCDQSGCGLNPFRYGPGTTYNTETNNADWFGVGSNFDLDSSQVFTVVTQFHTDSTGSLSSITRFYLQGDKRVDLPTIYVIPPSDGSHYGPFTDPSITKEYCTDIYDRWDGDGGYAPLAQMGKNMQNGMVLAMSAWYDQETYDNGKPEGTQTGMSWLDGVNNWGKYVKAGPCDTTTSDKEGPYYATFSNIKFGDIGTTVPDAPKPPPPPPPPPSSNCSAIYGQCGGKGWTGPTCCDTGCTCDKNGDYYSQCLPPAGSSSCS